MTEGNMTTADQWYADTDLTEIRDFNIATKKSEHLDKPWIVLLHGFPTCSYDWYKVWPTLQSDYSLLAFDFLGFGRSDKPYPHTYSVIEQAEITLAILAKHNITSCYFLVHNYGVSIAQEIISRLQDNRCNLNLKKVIFLNGGLFSEMHKPIMIQKLLLSPMGRIVNAFVSKSSLRRNFDQIFGPDTLMSDHELDQIWQLMNYNNGKRVFHLLINYINDRREHRDRWVKHMKSTSIPMKLVNGPLDPISGRHLVERYKELIPSPDTHIIEGIGHYPSLEAPQEIILQAQSYFK